MLLPQELQATHISKQTTPADTQMASPVITQAAANAAILTSASPPIIHQHSSMAFEASGASKFLKQQQLPSPASNVATKPFPGPPPVALAQQQPPQQPLRQGSHSDPHPSKDLAAAAAAATPVGLLELSLSADQIALLQAAADNAQSYLDKDAAATNENTEQVQDTSSGGSFSHHTLSLYSGQCIARRLVIWKVVTETLQHVNADM